jgi:ABC-type lipoprotein release transport system permease subunit
MRVPLAYTVRNVRKRWRTNLLAVSGVALVVASVAVLMAMAQGFQSALRDTGRPDNVVIVGRGTNSEVTSWIGPGHREALLDSGFILPGPDGRPLASWEWVSVLALPQGPAGRRVNVTLRGVTERARHVRTGIRLIAGRDFRPGLEEVVAGRRILGRARGLDLGGTLRVRRREFRVVGVFSAEGAAFESEVWGDFDVVAPLFRRTAGSSSVVVRVGDPSHARVIDRWIAAQPDMPLQAVPEDRYYRDQAGTVSTTVRFLAALVGLVMGVGAVFGAMNTMYGIVAARTREIGTLRALGFSRRAILFCFALESALLALLGGALGCLLAVPVHGYTTTTSNLQSFSEVAFAFRLTPAIAGLSLVFALGLGVLGGLLPALRAARLPIAAAVREA